MIQIPLYQGDEVVAYATIDEASLEAVSAYRWRLSKKSTGNYGYAVVMARSPKGWRQIGMHQIVLGRMWPNDGKVVDHIDRDGLNNRLSNLRVVDHSENARNAKVSKASTTGIRGVTLQQGRFKAQISIRGQHHWFGPFKTKEEAGEARRQAEIRLGYRLV